MSDKNGSRKGGWVYDKPTTEPEEEVKGKGYAWVSTSSFKRYV
jgi:hypothetical protein